MFLFALEVSSHVLITVHFVKFSLLQLVEDNVIFRSQGTEFYCCYFVSNYRSMYPYSVSSRKFKCNVKPDEIV